MYIRVLFLLFTVLLGTGFAAYAQSIRYSKQFVPPSFDRMKVMANVAGNHHLIFLKFNTTPSVYIFSEGLQLVGKKELPFNLSATYDRRIIPFKNFYLLYLHQPGSTRHELWQINAEGEATSLSVPFQHFIDSTFKKNTSTLQLINKEEQLVVVAHTYYSRLEQNLCSVVQLDNYLKPVSIRKVFYPFNRATDGLKQVMLAGENVLLLKYSKDDSSHYILELTKADLNTGKLLQHTFQSNARFDSEPAFTYTPADSSILVYTNIRSKVMVSKLDHLLNDTQPVTLLDAKFSNNVFANFLLLEGGAQKWLAIHRANGRPGQRPRIEWQNDGSYPPRLFNSRYSYDPFYNPYTSWAYNPDPVVDTAIRFASFSKEFRLVKDSVVQNKRSFAQVHVRDYASVLLGTKSYLVLKQSFTGRKKGLLLVSVNNDGHIATRDIAVFENYQYVLSNMETINHEEVLFPFLDKSEMGLVKVSVSKMEH